MKSRRDRNESKRSNLPRADFRKFAFQRLEQRLCLDDDSNINPVSHFNEDQAEYQTLLSGDVPDLAVQADAQVGNTGSSTPAQVGQWGPLEQWPIEFIGALMLPTGKVMGWDRLMNLRLWNTNTGQITIPSSPGYNIFCSGLSLLARRRVGDRRSRGQSHRIALRLDLQSLRRHLDRATEHERGTRIRRPRRWPMATC